MAVWAAQLGSLIEVVNRFGSFFYGSILGVFILAVGFRRATGTGAFRGPGRGHELGRLGRDVHRSRVSLAERRGGAVVRCVSRRAFVVISDRSSRASGRRAGGGLPEMITLQHLRKQYGDATAVDDVTFAAEPGRIFGLLGPNGAGKSTTIGCISGLLKPTSGRITVLGHDVVTDSIESRRELGIVPQELALYEELGARENLAYWGAAYGMSGDALKRRVLEVLETIGLADRATEPVKRFSGGMKRRLNFGCGIVHRPKVLLLDEPTVGVDPQSRVRLLDLVRQQAGSGTCVLYTTHYMEEAQDLCDRLAIIDHGKLLVMGTLDELRNLMGERDLVRLSGRFDPQAARRALEALGADVVSADDGSLRFTMEGASKKLPAIFGAVTSSGGDVQETSLTQPSLESLFIKLTGRELRE